MISIKAFKDIETRRQCFAVLVLLVFGRFIGSIVQFFWSAQQYPIHFQPDICTTCVQKHYINKKAHSRVALIGSNQGGVLPSG